MPSQSRKKRVRVESVDDGLKLWLPVDLTTSAHITAIFIFATLCLIVPVTYLMASYLTLLSAVHNPYHGHFAHLVLAGEEKYSQLVRCKLEIPDLTAREKQVVFVLLYHAIVLNVVRALNKRTRKLVQSVEKKRHERDIEARVNLKALLQLAGEVHRFRGLLSIQERLTLDLGIKLGLAQAQLVGDIKEQDESDEEEDIV